ncbi:MAG: arsenical-resistance protein, partial [Candidatus Brocadiales bacterium]
MEREMAPEDAQLTFFQKFLPLWVFFCMGTGILIGRLLPMVPIYLDRLSVFNVSVPIGICLFMMMYPIMAKIDFSRVVMAGKNPRPIILTLLINWVL